MTLPDADLGQPSVRILDDDTPNQVRHPRDLLGIALCVVGIALLLLLAVFAHATTAGIADDVREASAALVRLLAVPGRLLVLILAIVAPIAVLIELLVGRAIRQSALSLVASLVGGGLGLAALWALENFATADMLIGLSVYRDGQRLVTLPVHLIAIAALLTTAGPRTRRRTVAWSWNLMWIVLAFLLITGQITLPAAGLALAIGRLGGLLVRYFAGMASERAYGTALIDAVRRAGFEPWALARVHGIGDSAIIPDDSASPAEPVGGDGDTVPVPTTSAIARTAIDPASRAIARQSRQRVYALTTAEGPRLDVVVLDGDRQVIGLLSGLWESIRMRGIEGQFARSLRAVAERAALTTYAAESAGVRVPRLRGMASAEDSMLLIQEHAAGTVPWADLETEQITDGLLAELWRQIMRAHEHGLSHRQLTDDTVLVKLDDHGRPKVWLTGWESGMVASSELSRRLDLAQILALMALRVGAERAVHSATLAGIDVASIGPLVQTPTLPASTRAQVRTNRQVLKQLRTELANQLPDADIEPLQLARFTPKRIIMSALTVVALIVVMTSVGLDDLRDAVEQANPWWIAIAFGLGVVAWLGAAIALMAFAPTKVRLRDAFLVQVASSFVTLAAPAGIGPAVLNMRLLTTRKVTTSLAMATVTLVQVTQVAVTVVILLCMVVATGDTSVMQSLPSSTVLVTVVSVALAVVVLLLVPRIRRWLAAKTLPTFSKIWPRLSEIISQPRRILLGLLGNVTITLGYILAFDAALTAFGLEVSLVDAAIVYLVGNTVGAAVPTPGGVGAIEFALITGLTTTAGVPASVATSAVILFRVVTYWGRIPFGWLAMQRIQRQGLI